LTSFNFDAGLGAALNFRRGRTSIAPVAALAAVPRKPRRLIRPPEWVLLHPPPEWVLLHPLPEWVLLDLSPAPPFPIVADILAP